MRCKYCGSNVIHPHTEHKVFSGKKAAAGAVMFGVVGAAAGMIGKDTKGYKCGSCGAFMESPMEMFTESSVNSAIRDAESGRDRSMYDYFKGQYPNIQANIPVAAPAAAAAATPVYEMQPTYLTRELKEKVAQLKHFYDQAIWHPDCPIFVEKVLVKAAEGSDVLSLIAWNQSKKEIRSAYFKVTSYDDTGDKINEVSCVYQGLQLAPGGQLPAATEFKLNTEVAYRVEIECEKVAMADDTVWRNEGNLTAISLLSQGPLTRDNFPRYKYLRKELGKTTCKLNNEAPLFMPVKAENHWRCICGHPVLPGEICRFCNIIEKDLDECTSQAHLRQVQQTTVKAIAERRAKESQALWDKSLLTAYEDAEALLKADTIESVKKAIPAFEKMGEYKDSVQKVETAKTRLQELEAEKAKRDEEARIAAEKKAEEERIAAEKRAAEKKIADAKRNKMIAIIGGSVAAALVLFYVIFGVIIPGSNYSKAQSLMEERKFAEAIEVLQDLGDYKDAKDLLHVARNGEKMFKTYDDGVAAMNEGKYAEAVAKFYTIIKYKESKPAASGESAAAITDIKSNTIKGTADKAEEAAENLAKMATYTEFPDLVSKTQECFLQMAKQELDLSDVELSKYSNSHASAYYLLQSAGDYAQAKDMLSKFVVRKIYTDHSKAVNKYIWYNEAGELAIDEYGYQYIYDANGRLEKKVLYSKNSLKDPGNVKQESVFTYDANGRITTETNTVAGSSTPTVYNYTYDANGLLISREATLANGKTIKVTYKYDDKGQLTEETTENAFTNYKIVQTYTYDSEGKMVNQHYKRTKLGGTATYESWNRKYTYSHIYCPQATK